MRTFIAIGLPEELKGKIRGLQAELKKQNTLEGNWTSDYHITLKFLGEIDESKIKEISEKIKNICSKRKKFELELRGLGAFPSENYARVLWIGTSAGNSEAKGLQGEINSALEKIGFAKEKNYANHVTLIRVKSVIDKGKLKGLFEKYKEISFGTFMANEIKLIKSTLSSGGPTYETVATFPLA